MSRHGFLISVALKFNDVKLVNFNNRRRFVGIKFISVVIVDDELVELNMGKLIKLRKMVVCKILRISKTAIRIFIVGIGFGLWRPEMKCRITSFGSCRSQCNQTLHSLLFRPGEGRGLNFDLRGT
jgi:hypothetical protein